jgi:hypothetical protein
MRVNESVRCDLFPCSDMLHDNYILPGFDLDPDGVSIVMISEAAPVRPQDYYYADGNPSFQQTTVQAFNDAGVEVASIRELVKRGIYFTTAVKCGKTGYTIRTDTVNTCSLILEKELSLFQHVKAYLLMGDVAIKAFNQVARRAGEGRVIPAGSTYKIRGGEYYFHTARVFPSYLQVGPSFNIEKSKRRMIAEDIAAAIRLINLV